MGKILTESIKQDEIEKLANLANINITQDEQYIYAKDLNKIINYNVDHLNKFNTNKIKPTAHTSGIENVLRTDTTEPGLSNDEAVKNSKTAYKGFFKSRHVFSNK